MNWPTKPKMPVIDVVVIVLNAIAVVDRLILGQWLHAISCAIFLAVYWAWSSERRDTEHLRAIIKHAVDEYEAAR